MAGTGVSTTEKPGTARRVGRALVVALRWPWRTTRRIMVAAALIGVVVWYVAQWPRMRHYEHTAETLEVVTWLSQQDACDQRDHAARLRVDQEQTQRLATPLDPLTERYYREGLAELDRLARRREDEAMTYAKQSRQYRLGSMLPWIRVTNPENGRLVPLGPLNDFGTEFYRASTRSSAFAPDGKTVALTCADGPIRIVDLASGAEREIRTLSMGFYTSVAFSPDGKTIAAAAPGLTIDLIDVETGQRVRQVEWKPPPALDGTRYTQITLLKYTPAGNDLIAAALAFGPQPAWAAHTVVGRLDAAGADRWQYHVAGTQVTFLSFSHDGKTLAINGPLVVLLDLETGTTSPGLPALPGEALAVGFTPGGETVAVLLDPGSSMAFTGGSARWSGTMTLVQGTTLGASSHAIEGPHWAPNAIAISPDGRVVATGGLGPLVGSHSPVKTRDERPAVGALRLWDVASGRLIDGLEGPTGNGGITFSPDGSTLVTGDARYTFLIDAHTGALRRVLRDDPPERRPLDPSIVPN